jgi:regulator of RNase E activity RraA
MLSFQDVADAGPEERDAIMRALAEEMMEASAQRRGGRGFVAAERPRDLARVLGRDRRAQPSRRARSSS